MKRSQHSPLFLLAVLLLTACVQPTADTKKESPPNSPTEPKLSNLAGTYVRNFVITGSTSTQTVTIGSDGSYTVITRLDASANGQTTTSYSGEKGTISFSGFTATFTITHSVSDSATPISAETAPWVAAAQSKQSTFPACVLGSDLFISDQMVLGIMLLTAKGSTSGLLGTWEWLANTSDEYYTVDFIFKADNTCTMNVYSSNSSVMPSTPTQSTPGDFIINNNGSITFGQSSTIFYTIAGSYLILGDSISVNNTMLKKQ